MATPPFRRPSERPWPSLGASMVLIAGAALGFALLFSGMRRADGGFEASGPELVLLVVVMTLGGLSAVGPPLLLLTLPRRRRPWYAGRLLWFSTGAAAWLLWPPVVYRRIGGRQTVDAGSPAATCFAYGTPLMALYVVVALLAGGWLGRRRRRAARSWQETFGLLLGLAWACTGLYVLYLIYEEELRQ